jgi:hypothetical protein
VVEHNDYELHDHEQKAAVLHSYVNLLDSARTTCWSFDVENLYGDDYLDLVHLAAPFTQKEIQQAVQCMHGDASPGPDGFGSCFYKATWAITSPALHALFEAFYSLTTDLERLNRSYLVLLPKKENAQKPQDFQPISLQNSAVKAISKVLTVRLQPHIPDLVGGDQSGFVLGRCIADNFVYAADILNCCHRRNSPMIILKLDFHKAFDYVNWNSMDRILWCRGFLNKWCKWIQDLLNTRKTAVLLNGVPRRWINCQNGLR